MGFFTPGGGWYGMAILRLRREHNGVERVHYRKPSSRCLAEFLCTPRIARSERVLAACRNSRALQRPDSPALVWGAFSTA